MAMNPPLQKVHRAAEGSPAASPAVDFHWGGTVEYQVHSLGSTPAAALEGENNAITSKSFGDDHSIGWFKGKVTGNSHISWENLAGFRFRFSLSRQPIES